MRRICTKDNPYTPERDKEEPGHGWAHPDACETETQQSNWPCGDTVRMECPHCKISWTEELPQ